MDMASIWGNVYNKKTSGRVNHEQIKETQKPTRAGNRVGIKEDRR